MSNMADVNGTDHLVRQEKESKLNGYDNEGFHYSHGRSEDEDESASDDDRLRTVVVTENGHRPEDDPPPSSQLSNGHVREEQPNGYSVTTVNGSAVIVVEDSNRGDPKTMNSKDASDGSPSQKQPLDTRLHHFVPVEDIDRKILNGSSDATRVTIPGDAVINFNTGRVKVRKGAAMSNNQLLANDRESIPLETMLPSYEAEDKIGLGVVGGEKAELEAELANHHKNGLWSEGGHNAYGSPDSPFGKSEKKLNGTSKSGEEISLPAVNNHRKCLSSDVSDTSSEQKSTGEKLYFTEENRKLCPGWQRVILCGLILIILAVALLVGVLAATGILLAESDSKATKYESGHSLPSIDSISQAGHSFRPRPPSKVPQKFLPPVTDDADIPPNSTIAGVGDTVSRPPLSTVTSKVPALNDSSHSQTIVPNALVGEFTIDENFTDDLKDNSSEGYQSLAKYLERELYGIFKKNGGVFEDLKILSFSPGSIKIKFVIIWSSNHDTISSEKAIEILNSHLKKNRYSLLAYPVNLDSIHFTNVFDECKIQKGGCSFQCLWDYSTLTKTCICTEDMALMADGTSCGPKPLTSTLETTTSEFIYQTPPSATTISATTISATTISATTISATEFSLSTKESTITTLEQFNSSILSSTQIPEIITKAINTISELFNEVVTTETTNADEKTSTEIQNIPIINELSTITGITDSGTTTEEYTNLSNRDFMNSSVEIVDETITEVPALTDTFPPENTEIIIPEEFNVTENFNVVPNLTLDTISDLGIQTTTIDSTTGSPLWNESHSTESDAIIPGNTEQKNDSTAITPPTTRPYGAQEDNMTTIGYHIVEKTTEVYILSNNTDNYFGGMNETTSEPTSTAEELPITSTTNLQTTSTPHHNPDIILTTTELIKNSSDGTIPEIPEYTTKNPVGMSTDPTVNTEDAQYYTTMQTVYNFTDIVDLKSEVDNTLSEDVLTGNGTVSNATHHISNETNVFDTTTVSPLTTISILSVIPQFNRTPEVRSFDDDVQNDTYVASNDTFSTDETIPEASTETSTYADNSSNTKLSDDDTLNSSPFTTILPTIEPLSQTTRTQDDSPNANVNPNEFVDPSNVTINVNHNEFEKTTENTITEPAIYTEPITEFTTLNPQLVSTVPEIASVTISATNSTNENNSTTLQPTELEYHNETDGLSENNGIILNGSLSIENSTVVEPFDASGKNNMNSSDITGIPESLPDTTEITTVSVHNETITVSPHNETTTMNLHEETTTMSANDKTITVSLNDETTTESLSDETTKNLYHEPTMSVYNDTLLNSANETTDNLNNESIENVNNTTLNLHDETKTQFFDTTIPSIQNGNDTTSSENYTTLDDSTSFLEYNNTENSLLFTTSDTRNISNNETTPDSNLETASEGNINELNINHDKITGNETLVDLANFTQSNASEETYTTTNLQDFSFPTPPIYNNESDANTTAEPHNDAETSTASDYINSTDELNYESDITHTISDEDIYEIMNSTLLPGMNESSENVTFTEDFGNFTTDDYEAITNETTTNARTGIECREDQFHCEPLNKCINDTFMCDGIADCPDGQDEFDCKDTCYTNFMCANSSSNTCIMSDARCDGIWDCENGTDEESCTPTECAKHEVMCNDGSKCIKPGHICDWKYNCLDRSDEVGCVERTTCESGGRFFCNDGLCIPWSLKCDGEHDCKEGEDEGNCTCLNDEFQCNDGKCLKSSTRCDGHQDCHDADDEMGCVNVDSQHVVSTYEPYSGTWSLLCAEDWNLDDGQYLCQELGFGHALSVEKSHVAFNGTWMAMRRDNLTETSLWTERVSFVESCNSGMAAAVKCQEFTCGEYTGLLHRRKRDVISSSSSQWPFIGYASTFHSNKGCLSEILTPIWLITSAECLLSISKEPFNGSDWYVRTSIGRNVEADVAQNHEVLRIITHSHSSKFRSLTLRDYDVALIRLKHALVFVSDKIGAICPPDEQVPPGITCFSGVLGTEKPRAPPPPALTINSLALQILDRRNCNSVEHYNSAINHRMLCTQSSEGHTICDNDEGTPLMCLTGINKWFLAGMLTYQRFCDVYNKHPAVFSNLFAMRKFLDQVTGQKQYEIPYDDSIYTIIPPTTPSPTLPETTTIMTTEITTESTFTDTTYVTPSTFENRTESILDTLEEINSTTVTYDELAREENDTVILHSEITAGLSNTTEDGFLYENETVTIPYGADFVINSTSEELREDLLTNGTHSYLTSMLNETYSSDFNTTDVFVTDNSNETSTYNLSEATTVSLDLTNMTTLAELNNTYNPTEISTPSTEELTTATITSTHLKEKIINETIDPEVDAATGDNTTIDSSMADDTTDITLPDFNAADNITTETSLINVFNESLEMFKPMIALTNEKMLTNQPSISLTNDTTGFEKLSSLPDLGAFDNNTKETLTESSLLEISTDALNEVTTVGTTTIPTTEIVTLVESVNEFKTTTSPLSDAIETFEFEVEDEPDRDLAIRIFKDSDKLKFEPYSRLENNETINSIITNTTKEDTKVTTNLPIYETSSLSPVTAINPTEYVSDTNELNLKSSQSDDITGQNNTEFRNKTSNQANYTSAPSEMTTTEAINSSILDIEQPENITNTPHVLPDIDAVENLTMKMHLISEELTVLPDNTTSLNIKTEQYENSTNTSEVMVDASTMSTEELHLISGEERILKNSNMSSNATTCGLWNDTYVKSHNVSRDFFTRWPALGYLKMVSDAELCPAALISDKLVITSTNCLTSMNSNLESNKWIYLDGSYQSDLIENALQSYAVEKIIPYTGESTSVFLNNHDITLVKLKNMTINNYTRKACLPEFDPSPNTECFITGWNKNAFGDNKQKQFYDAPISIISTEECNNTKNYDGILIEHLICGTHKERDHVCQMNLGSPLFCQDENDLWNIYGVLNYSGACNTDEPTVFSSIASVRKWITDILTNDTLLN